MINSSKNQREVLISAKQKEKLQKQPKERWENDKKITYLARIELDLDGRVEGEL